MGHLVSLKCECGLEETVSTGTGMRDLVEFDQDSDPKYKYFIYDKGKHKIIGIESYEKIEIYGFIPEQEIERSARKQELIFCPNCNSKSLKCGVFGFWD